LFKAAGLSFLSLDAVQAAGAGFLGAFVEFVEALTVILALGATRGWASPLLGTAAALAVLAAVAMIFGPALQAFDTPFLRLAIGLLVLLFGLRWLRKAILRAAGALPLRDEEAAYSRAKTRFAAALPIATWDWAAFAGGFQVTLLEGSEVAFIVVALGAGRAGLLPAGCGAGLALLVVAALGLTLHRPLSRIPENTLKCAVGILLAAFGTFWTGEGLGVRWPGGDLALALLSLFWAGWTLLLIRVAALGRARPAGTRL
jgi:uncharacterized membrane protein